jgi:hypothetical protein
MLILGLILLAIGGWGFMWGGKLWRHHRWQVEGDLIIIACLILGFVLTLFAPKGEGYGRAVYFEPDAASPR